MMGHDFRGPKHKQGKVARPHICGIFEFIHVKGLIFLGNRCNALIRSPFESSMHPCPLLYPCFSTPLLKRTSMPPTIIKWVYSHSGAVFYRKHSPPPPGSFFNQIVLNTPCPGVNPPSASHLNAYSTQFQYGINNKFSRFRTSDTGRRSCHHRGMVRLFHTADNRGNFPQHPRYAPMAP